MIYFCIVKRMNIIKQIAILTFFILNVSGIKANGCAGDMEWRMDSVQISLLTCSPHNEVYSLYGHTAIRYRDKLAGTDLAINYGVFSFSKPFFVLRFVFGLTDYEMGIESFDDFCREYQHYGSHVTEQVLDLTTKEKLDICRALEVNAMPENRVYRYNYFYNNCTSKARDIILENIGGKVAYTNKVDKEKSFREIIHSCNEDFSWARFGNDILLGVKADASTSREEQQFLPTNLMNDFASAVVDRDGVRKPLVKRTNEVVKGNGVIDGESNFPLTPIMCASVMLILSVLVSLIEHLTKKSIWWYDSLVLLLLGLTGLVLFAMIFSQHPTVSLNLQIILFNPLFLYFAYYITKHRKDRAKCLRIWKIVACFVILSIIGRIFQHYAEGVLILALSLLIRTQDILFRNSNLVRKNDK